jgi:hypothetical protein
LAVLDLIEDGFHRSPEFFMAVAGLTSRHDVAFVAFSSTGQRHDMIHRQILRSDELMTQATFPLLDLGFPPGRFAKFLCPLALYANMPLNGIIVS